MSATVTREELAETRAQMETIAQEVSHLRAEFAFEDADRGQGTMSDEEHERLVARLDRMHPEHQLAMYLMLSDAVHGRLAGKDHDLMSMLKTIFISVCANWVDPATFATAWRICEEEEDFDTSYLDEEADDA